MDQIRTMEIFRSVAECCSFSQAAAQLDLPRPTVTNAVQRLEQQLGTRLLQRTTRKVSLTVEGSLYLERCIRLLGEFDELGAMFTGPGHQPRGLVRVDLPERMAHLELIPRLPEFLRAYPDIQLRIGASDRVADLVAEGIDCAVRVGTLRDSSLVARRIGELGLHNLAARDYLAQHGTPRTPADLADHYEVKYYSSQAGRDLSWEYHQDGVDISVPMRSLISVTSTEAYMASCRAGLGLIQAPRTGIAALLASGELVEVLPQWRARPMPVSVVYAHNRHLSARVRVFVDWLIDTLKPV